MKERKIWGCKIGYADAFELPPGSDNPMRKAIEKAFKDITGHESDFCLSGWGEILDEKELSVIEDRYPKHSKSLRELLGQLILLVEVLDESNKPAMKTIIKELERIIIREILYGN